MTNSKRKIFLLDDNPVFRFWLKEHLEHAGDFQVFEFHRATDFITQLDQAPEYLILDHYLESTHGVSLNGLELLKLVKQALPTAKSILISGYINQRLLLEAYENGAYDVIKKSNHTHKRVVNAIKCLDLAFQMEESVPSYTPFLIAPPGNPTNRTTIQ